MIPPEVLEQLQDIRQPPAASWWPPAPGWWTLLALVLLLLALAGFWRWRHYRRSAPGREALRQLANFPVPDAPSPDWFARLNRLLKETAMARYPEQNPAGLSGSEWQQFLATTGDSPQQPWRHLVEASYRPQPELSPGQALAMAKSWVRSQSW